MALVCYVVKPDAVVYEVEVDMKAKGEDILEKICSRLGILERDYLGLQYKGARGETLWINLRNQVRRQVPGHAPIRLLLRIKFWVPPHLVQQESTRELMFTQIRWDLAEGRLRLSDADKADLVALMCQAENGDFAPASSTLAHAYSQLAPSSTPSLLQNVAARHKCLQGLTRDQAIYSSLQKWASVESFGMEYFRARRLHDSFACTLGVGPQGVTVFDSENKQVSRYGYPTISMVRANYKMVHFTLLDDRAVESEVEYKLSATPAANALYRSVTEKHDFYSCQTVRAAVTDQFIRDLKGTIVSLFKENTPLGKKYVFDIQRTCREVYDNTRRQLFYLQQQVNSSPAGQHQQLQLQQPMQQQMQPSTNVEHRRTDKNSVNKNYFDQPNTEELEQLKDCMVCRICMDAPYNTVFSPCNHVVACDSCARLCDRCPICRTPVTRTAVIYLPFSLHDAGVLKNLGKPVKGKRAKSFSVSE